MIAWLRWRWYVWVGTRKLKANVFAMPVECATCGRLSTNEYDHLCHRCRP